MNREAETVPVCPTRCDPECASACHEVHLRPAQRHHDVLTCPAWRAWRAAQPGGDVESVLGDEDALASFLSGHAARLDSYEIWGGTERPEHVLTLGTLRRIHGRIGGR